MNNTEQANLPEVKTVKPLDGVVPVWMKRAVLSAGLILLIVGIPVAINLFCIVPLVVLNGIDFEGVIYGVFSLMFALLTLGVGSVAFLHANRSLQNKPSKLLQLPFPLLFVGIFIFLLGLGSVILAFDVAAGLFFPPILIVCASLPPIWAVAWMIPQSRATSVEEDVAVNLEQPSLRWRRGLLSFAGGATVSVLIAIV